MIIDTIPAGLIIGSILIVIYVILNTTHKNSIREIEQIFVCRTQFGVKLATVKNQEECVQILNMLDDRIKGAKQ